MMSVGAMNVFVYSQGCLFLFVSVLVGGNTFINGCRSFSRGRCRFLFIGEIERKKERGKGGERFTHCERYTDRERDIDRRLYIETATYQTCLKG